jgi:hypothetical protein
MTVCGRFSGCPDASNRGLDANSAFFGKQRSAPRPRLIRRQGLETLRRPRADNAVWPWRRAGETARVPPNKVPENDLHIIGEGREQIDDTGWNTLRGPSGQTFLKIRADCRAWVN